MFLDNGIETITKNCRDSLSECSSKEQNGASLFKKGIDLVKQSESSFFKALKELEDNTKAIKSIDSGLLAIVDTLEKEDLAVKGKYEQLHFFVRISHVVAFLFPSQTGKSRQNCD